MKNLAKNFIKFSGITLTVIAPLLAFSQETFAQTGSFQPSSFQNSCNNTSITGNTLFATCRRRDGSPKKTSIRIRGIANDNGNLVFIGLNNASSFQRSCNRISITGDGIIANCRRRNGSYNTTAISIPGIKNNNGNLTYKM